MYWIPGAEHILLYRWNACHTGRCSGKNLLLFSWAFLNSFCDKNLFSLHFQQQRIGTPGTSVAYPAAHSRQRKEAGRQQADTVFTHSVYLPSWSLVRAFPQYELHPSGE